MRYSIDRINTIINRSKKIKKISRIKFKDNANPLEIYCESEFKARYKFNKETCVYIFSLIEESLKGNEIRRGLFIPPIIKFFIALRFYVSGSFQISTGDHFYINQSTVSRVVSRVSISIASLCQQFVKFPTHGEAIKIRKEFYEASGFPGIVGAIDCTHVKIESPGGNDAELFRNRKGEFSINVQAICDYNLNISNIVARWYGSCHDSRIFENSSIKDKIESNEAPGLLVGDAGYPLRPYLMKPFENPDTISKKRFNKAQIKARNCVERCFGVLKRRFPCLKYLRLKLKNILNVIVAVVVLHNIGRIRTDIFENDIYEVEDQEQIMNISSNTMGINVRNNILISHFT